MLACAPAAAPQPRPGAALAESQRAAPARPIFAWRAQVGASTVHLLGSVHVARSDLYPLDPRIEGAFAESDVLVLEIALDEAAQIEAAQRMLELGRLSPGTRLPDVVKPETWDLLVQTQERRGQSLFGLRGFRPWLVALTLTTQALASEGFSAEQGIDEHFRRAAVGNKRIEALETVESQLGLFTGLSPQAEEELLRQTLENVDGFGAELAAAFELWSAGDANGLERLLVAPLEKDYPEMYRSLFVERNLAMTERLLGLTRVPGRYFVVVGAGHMLGDSGIVELLRARGIEVRQL